MLILGASFHLATGVSAQEISAPLEPQAETEPVAVVFEPLPAEIVIAPVVVDPAREPSLEELPLEIQQIPPSVAPLPVAGEATSIIGNTDIIEMVGAQFGETTIIAAIQANPTHFDVAPKALLTLKSAGVPERVIEAMLATEAAKKTPSATTAGAVAPDVASAPSPATASAEPAPIPEAAPPPATVSPEAMAALSQMLERLAAQSSDTDDKAAEKSEPAEEASTVPRAWVHADGEKGALTLTIAQVAVTDAKRSGNGAFKTLRGLAEKALPFANPTLGLAATGFQSLFRPDDPSVTAVWALLGPSAERAFTPDTAFEIEFGDIPGINPDAYRPAIVQLVPTEDNYRLVGAAKTTASDAARMPNGPIIEEPVAAQLKQLARGHYRVSLSAPLAPGEYALVLRPIATGERERRKETQDSLGELMGGGTSQVLYLTWDFSIRS